MVRLLVVITSLFFGESIVIVELVAPVPVVVHCVTVIFFDPDISGFVISVTFTLYVPVFLKISHFEKVFTPLSSA